MNTRTTTTASRTTVRQPRRWAAGAIRAALVASLASVPLAITAPAEAAVLQVSGVGDLATGQCKDAVPPGFTDFTLSMTGDLEGCLYTNVDTAVKKPSGMYLETGAEFFVGRLNGRVGTFTTTYKFEAKFAPDGSEIHGRCQHPLVEGSGTGVFDGASGQLNFKDVVETGEYLYKGHIDVR